jgi:hypothetical protein
LRGEEGKDDAEDDRAPGSDGYANTALSRGKRFYRQGDYDGVIACKENVYQDDGEDIEEEGTAGWAHVEG